jgi:hypothetical protein
MVAPSLVLALSFLGQSAPAADPSSLVDQLGARRYADREAAAKGLELLGRAAIPALQSAREARDMEIRTRATALLHKIEGTLLTQASMIALDFKDASIAEVAQSLSERSGMKIDLFPQNLPRWKLDRLSLQESEPLPFWKAIDRLCASAGLQSDLEMRAPTPRSEPTLTLIDRSSRPVYPVFDHGPFRIYLIGLDYQRHVGFAVVPQPARAGGGVRPALPRDLAIPQPRAVTSFQCTLQLQIVAEPRLGMRQAGPLQILEARDDRGISLVPENQAIPIMGTTAGYLAASCSPVLHLRAPLNRPEAPGKKIELLRGTIPLRITSRQPDPLVVPLASSAGKSFGKGDIQLAIHEVRSDANHRQRQIELSIHEDRSDGLPVTDDTLTQPFGQRVDPHQQNIEIIDTRGQALPWFQTSLDPQSSRITLTLAGLAGAEPKELRYYRLTETSVDVPFSFTDVLMP